MHQHNLQNKPSSSCCPGSLIPIVSFLPNWPSLYSVLMTTSFIRSTSVASLAVVPLFSTWSELSWDFLLPPQASMLRWWGKPVIRFNKSSCGQTSSFQKKANSCQGKQPFFYLFFSLFLQNIYKYLNIFSHSDTVSNAAPQEGRSFQPKPEDAR